MKAWGIESYGGPEKLKLLDVPTPAIASDEVLIQIKAASINPVDFKIRGGGLKFILPYPFPLILGNDCAGVVTEVGSAVKDFKVGDEVFARPHKDRIGTFAEYVAAKSSAVALKPKNTTFAEAASLPLVGLTSWQAMVPVVKKGDKVFIPAGAGGVGSFAIQLAKQLGAYVASNSSTKNLDYVRSLGADEVIDYKTQDFSAILKDYDMVFDTMGYETQKKAFRILKSGGTLTSIVGPPTKAFMRETGAAGHIQAASAFLEFPAKMRAWHHDAHYRFLFMKPDGVALQAIARYVEDGLIKPQVGSSFSFADTPKAMELVESGRSRGKVVITTL